MIGTSVMKELIPMFTKTSDHTVEIDKEGNGGDGVKKATSFLRSGCSKILVKYHKIKLW